MDRLRRILQRVLPRWWWDRIDLETASIRHFVSAAGLRVKSGERVLDAGAGQSRYRSFFDHAIYTSVDFGTGEKTWDYSGLDVLARLERLPFPGDVFDHVICTQVLEHVPEPDVILRELGRVLKPGGYLLLTAPLGFGEHQIPYDYFRYTRYGLRYLLEKVGFDVHRIEPRGGYFRYMAVMLMWSYIYLFPENRRGWIKAVLFPVQILGAIVMVVAGPPLIQSLDRLDTEKRITLGFAVECTKRVVSGEPVSEVDGDAF
ncbi:class I SAM-dependent methyltransferase [bacterium]|nr:class I SAM-dependent methyltransferase [candidate division CSSED10-310 bacterium]